ncbi:MAG: branched-chain amino acid ABC transporter permease [SAR324 cluster bacterium]|nr:branched-chain amino acid ABC transporter permease [SAR324 cluster bacterium]
MIQQLRENLSREWKVLLGFLAAAILLPIALDSYNSASEIWIFGLLAVAFNLLLGYTGLLSFGQAIFFGLGAYVSGLILLHLEWNIFVIMVAAIFSGGLAAMAIGYFCVQRVGIYFILLTFSFNLMVYFIAYEWDEVTGSVDGLFGADRPFLSIPGLFELDMGSYEAYYVFTVVVVMVCYYLISRIVRSPFGKVLTMIRENEERAAALGCNVRLYKLMVFTIAGMFSSLAGMLYTGLFQYVPIDAIEWLTSANIVFMALIGGIANMIGPMIGAGIFIMLSDTLSVMWARWPLLLGLIFMAVILFCPGGMLQVGAKAKNYLRSLKARRAAGRAEAGD